MRTEAFVFAVLVALSPLVASAPLPGPQLYGKDGAQLQRRTSGGSTLNIPRGSPHDVMINDDKPMVTAGTLAPASAVHSRNVVRRPVVGTVVSRWSKSTPPQLLTRALDKDTAGGNAYSGSSGDASGGDVGALNTLQHARTLGPRTDDAGTMGGNAYTGSSGDVSGGSIANVSNNDGMPTLMNVNSNNAGLGGTSTSGCASGGDTNGSGGGGNAYSGSSGKAEGGSVSNVGGMVNMNSNNGGDAGTSATGCATGGKVGQAATPNNDSSAFIL